MAVNCYLQNMQSRGINEAIKRESICIADIARFDDKNNR